MDRISGVYAIYQGSEERYAYVGATGDMRRRQAEHQGALRRGKHENWHLQRAWDKCGAEDFYFTLVERCPVELLVEREKHWTSMLGPAYSAEYLAGKGTCGKALSAETRARISAALRGKAASAETRARMSAAQRARFAAKE